MEDSSGFFSEQDELRKEATKRIIQFCADDYNEMAERLFDAVEGMGNDMKSLREAVGNLKSYF